MSKRKRLYSPHFDGSICTPTYQNLSIWTNCYSYLTGMASKGPLEYSRVEIPHHDIILTSTDQIVNWAKQLRKFG